MPFRRLSPAALCCAAVLAAGAAAGCAGGASSTQSPHGRGAEAAGRSARERMLARGQHDGDRDDDSHGFGPLDDDGDAVPTYGPAAGQAERRAILALLERYYAAASAGDASTVCSLLYPPGVEILLEEHDGGKGPASLRGNSCRQIAAKLLRRGHAELAARRATLRMPLVETRAQRAWAVLDFGAGDEQLAILHREGDAWALTTLREEAL